MNLAVRDIRRRPGRFALSCVGVGLLLTLVLSYSGIYNGFVYEALAIINKAGADLWVVQRDTRGPFAEQSRLPEDIRYRMAIAPGVAAASPYIFYTIQRQWQGRSLRFAVIGYDLHVGLGGPREIIAGRGIGQAHYEMVADAKLNLPIGSTVPLGLHDYTVVGLTRGMVGSNGDPAAFFSLADAQEIQFVKDNWAIRNLRERADAMYAKALPTQPSLSAQLARNLADNPDLHTVNAILVRLDSGVQPGRLAEEIDRWKYFTAYTTEKQSDLMLAGSVERGRRQTLLFRIFLTLAATVIMAQIIYTMTLEKLGPIALLKLIGAPDRTIVGLVLQESLALGVIAYGIALMVGSWTYDKWPRLVLVETGDKLTLLALVVAICVVASVMGIRRALRVDPGAALIG
ncbi:MAG: ABC transporter permease [Deltaproteobacteria bacterium]|nr:ABC transporter permease [Deltaproteobacteria bacterium]